MGGGEVAHDNLFRKQRRDISHDVLLRKVLNQRDKSVNRMPIRTEGLSWSEKYLIRGWKEGSQRSRTKLEKGVCQPSPPKHQN